MANRQNNSQTGNYPVVNLTMGVVQRDVPIRVRLDVLLSFSVSIIGFFTPMLTGNDQVFMTIPNMFALSLMFLAKRLYYIVKSRPDDFISVNAEPQLNVNIMPRPLYSILSCLGDIEMKEFQHRVRIYVSEAEIRFLCEASNFMVENGFDPATDVLHCTLNDAALMARNVMVLAVHLNYQGDQADPAAAVANMFPNTFGAVVADYNAILGLLGQLLQHPFRVQGRYQIQFVGNAAGVAFAQHINNTLRGVPLIFGLYNNYNGVEPNPFQVRFGPQFLSILQKLSSKYRFSGDVSTSNTGAPSLTASVMTAAAGRYYVSSSLPLSPSHMSMAFICNFRYRYYMSEDVDGYQSSMLGTTPGAAMDIWLQQNII